MSAAKAWRLLYLRFMVHVRYKMIYLLLIRWLLENVVRQHMEKMKACRNMP